MLARHYHGGRLPGFRSRRHNGRYKIQSVPRTAASCLCQQGHNPECPFEFDGRKLPAREVIDLLTPFLTEERIERISKVVSNRTKNVLPIVEGLHDLGNLAAVCRSADAFGLASVHCIKRSEKYKNLISSRTAAGADKWLDVKVWDNTADCLSAVKRAGYQLVVTHLTRGSVTIQDIDWSKPTAFVLGNERDGVSDEAVEAADLCAIIEMSGFVESFNISVAAALVMYEARTQRQRTLGHHGDLDPDEVEALKASMMMRTLKQPDMLIKELLSRQQQEHAGQRASEQFSSL